MGYESKIYFVKKYSFTKKFGDEEYSLVEIVASIDMCKMGSDPAIQKFHQEFNIDEKIFLTLPVYDEEIDEEVLRDTLVDAYGDKLLCADCSRLKELIKEQIEYEKKSEFGVYWRFKILYKMLKAFEKYDDILVVHYGY